MRKKWITAIFALLLSTFVTFAQPDIFVSTSSNTLEDGTIELIFTMEIEAGWYVYGATPVGGPTPATLIVDESDKYQLIGSLKNAQK